MNGGAEVRRAAVGSEGPSAEAFGYDISKGQSSRAPLRVEPEADQTAEAAVRAGPRSDP
jgi:hypothetical protein